MPGFPLSRPVAFPLFAITSEGKCACGVDGCSRVGKHAAVNWGDLEYGTPVPRPAPGAGAALRTGAHPLGSDCFVVDLDGEAAALAFDELGPCPDTFTVQSPRAGGGWHLYFRHPGFPVKNSASDLGKGIDIRGDGGIIVAPGSPHANGGRYEVCLDAPLADAPEWLLTWLKRQKVNSETQAYPGDVTDPVELERRRGLYTAFLRDEAPARGPERRGPGDATLFNVVQRGAYDLALPVDDVLELVREHYDPRCSPPWGDELEERVHHKARDAKQNSSRPRAEPLPSDLAHLAGSGSTALEDLGITPDNSKNSVTAGEFGFPGEVWGGWDEPILPPVYLLEGLIPEGKVVTFFAEGGSLKSWAAFSLAIAVATGESWLGKSVKQGRALIIDYEDGRYEFQRRIRLLRGGTLDPLDQLGYAYSPGTLENVEFWKQLARNVQANGIRLVVIDALNSGMPGDVDENDSSFSIGMKLAGRMTELGVTVVFIHHANKSGGMRGHSSIRDQSDVVFQFDPVSETDDTKRMRMICQKPGPQKKPHPVNVELSDAGLRSFEDEAADATRNATTVDAKDDAILLHLEQPKSLNELVRLIGGRKASVKAAVDVLISQGKVVKLPGPGGHDVLAQDDDARRNSRVLRAVPDFHGSEAGLAAEARVPAAWVAGMIKRAEIKPNGSGFIVRGLGVVVPDSRV